jgi:hypothetical protein
MKHSTFLFRMMSHKMITAARRSEQATANSAEAVQHGFLAKLSLYQCRHLAAATAAACHHILKLKEVY